MTVAPIGVAGVGCMPGVPRSPAPCPDMPIDTYLTTLPPGHREAVRRARNGLGLEEEDGARFLKVIHWITWAPMSEDDKDRLTLELLTAARIANSWDAAR